MSLAGKKIVLCVTGGIAAYKSADLASRLRKAGAEVRVSMTRAAKEFIAPLTFEAICGHPAYHEVFGQDLSYRMEHIEWARWADALIVAPASTDFLAKMAHGLADDGPSTLYLAYRGPVFVAPAMNTVMWDHPATQANLKTLTERSVRFIGPGSGPLACGEVGEGRMAEPAEIVQALEAALDNPEGKPLAGKKVLITAGPTREALDPIRFISNRSTGRMGSALAAAAARLGAKVYFIHGPLSVPTPEGIEPVPVEGSRAMLESVQTHLAECDVAIFAAAVANYQSNGQSTQKIKGGATLDLHLVRTPDIAQWAGEHRKDGQIIAGFAAESENLMEAAKGKLEKKKLDLIFANWIGVAGVGFEARENEVTMLDREGHQIGSGKMNKDKIADWIWDQILARLNRR